tara:strand:+ start:694 stop:837 length:144 start_codon:yes stop_codon:yes gene_type:complete
MNSDILNIGLNSNAGEKNGKIIPAKCAKNKLVNMIIIENMERNARIK